MRSARRSSVPSALAAALALALLPASPAVAGDLFWSQDMLVYLHNSGTEPAAEHEVRVTVAGAELRLEDATAEVTVPPGDPCRQDGPHAGVCPAATLIFARLGLFTDTFVNDTPIQAYACGEGGDDTLTGGAGPDLLFGGRGRDAVSGRAGKDTVAISDPIQCAGGETWDGERLDGGDDNDQIHGGAGADVLIGGDGDDSLRGYAASDQLDGGAGVDDLGGFEGDDALAGGDGNDLLFGGAGDDRIDGGDGNDLVGGRAVVDADGPTGASATVTLEETGDDVLDGGPGDDVLVAGPGEREFNFEDPRTFERRGGRDRTLQSAAPNGADIIRGGPGADEATYFNRGLPVRVTPDGIADDGSEGERDRVDADVEAITGGASGDVLIARTQGSFLFGDLGADALRGDDGPDVLRGGATDSAADVVLGGGGDDDLGGGGGDDRVEGGPGRDVVAGDDGDDLLLGQAGEDTLAGGTGADRLEGGAGADCLHGFLPSGPQAGCPALPGEPATTGADGADVLAGGDGADRIDGGPGEDVADYSGASGPVLAALAGADPGAAANERPWADRDTLAADVEGARGGPRGDTLLGNASDNVLDGGPGDDLVDGGAGADRLRGGPGRDLLLARDAAADELRCGTARDVALIDGDDELVALRADLCERVDAGGRSRLARVVGTAACPARVRLPGIGRTFRLPVAGAVPFGTRVLTEACGVAVQPPRQSRAARLSGGAFSVERGRLVLRGGCTRRLSVIAGPALRVDGRFAHTRGANASWTVADRCDRTRVAVTRGRVGILGHGVLRAPHARTVRR